jgi:hypothetical protein
MAVGCLAGVLLEVKEDGSWSWDTLEILRGVLTDRCDLLHEARVRCRWWRSPGARAGVQDGQILGRGLLQAFEPLVSPADRTTQAGGQLLLGPLRMLAGQAAQGCPLGDPLGFHSG